MTTKTCSRCEETKRLAEFDRNKGGLHGRGSQCKACRRVLARERRIANLDATRQRALVWYYEHHEEQRKRNRERYAERRDELTAKRRAKPPEEKRDAHLRNRYGITLEDARQMLLDQGNRCPVCEFDLDMAEGVIDHCHETGVVRGVLHSRCNTGLGYFSDDADALRRGAAYLEQTQVADEVA